MRLADKTVLITGADGGIGQGFTRELLKKPVRHLVLGVRNPKLLPVPATPAGGAREVSVVQVDLDSFETVEAAADRLADLQIDVLINNAGLYEGGPLVEQDLERVYALTQVNLTALEHLTARLLPGMIARRRGYVVNNASISGYAYFSGTATYAATKAGVVAFSEALRRELRGTGVRVMHLVTPGIDTPMLRQVDDTYQMRLKRITPDAWARRTVRGIERNRTMVNPQGWTYAVKLASRGPSWLLDRFQPRLRK